MKLTGSKTLNELLQKMGMYSYSDVIFHLPRSYDSFELTPREKLLHMANKEKVVVHVRLIGKAESLCFHGGTSNVRFYALSLETGLQFQIVAWNRPYLSGQLKDGDEYTIKASYDASRHCLNMISLKKGDIPSEERIQPVYSLPKDYPDHHYRTLVRKSIEECKGTIPDIIPSDLRTRYRLLPKEQALANCHFPNSMDSVREGMRTLKYEEALLFTLRNLLIRQANKTLVHSRERKFSHAELTSFVRSLPFSLTKSQNTACREIVLDMEKRELMNRLLQGDVGTGKTLVSAIAMYVSYLRGQQSALMAPTDSLARQHYRFLKDLFAPYSLTVELLVGSCKPSERRGVLSRLYSGEIDILVGTHALFSKDVIYRDLGLCVIDEQHKFGVNQRSLLAHKGGDADLLLMSATPIPRTLSMTLYGDLDVSTLHDFPSGKRDVESLIVKSGAKKIESLVKASLSASSSVFVVAPQIEESAGETASAKTVFELYEDTFPGQVVLLHGKMGAEQKEDALNSFQQGKRRILVATSVIEVGIDVKDANLMIVYEAHRFSLSSLHQLRGRIGRNGGKATFVMVSDGNEEEKEKLKVIVSSEDGFEIAEADLRMRGPGTLAGLRQSGMPDFRYANLVNDFKIFETARNDAYDLLERKDGEALSFIEYARALGGAILDS